MPSTKNLTSINDEIDENNVKADTIMTYWRSKISKIKRITPKNAEQAFDELRQYFEKYEIIDDNTTLSIKNRNTGIINKTGESHNIDNIIARVNLADSWVKANITNTKISGKKNEFGIDEYAYQYCFNDGAKTTFTKILENVNDIDKKNINDFSKEIKDASKYKYAELITRGLLVKSFRSKKEINRDRVLFNILYDVSPIKYDAVRFALTEYAKAHALAQNQIKEQNTTKIF